MVRDRAVIHINIADFAARVETCLTPSLGDRPLIIAPEGAPRARVYDMNEHAFQEGIRKGMPLAKARRLHPKIPVLPPRFRQYSLAMKEILTQAAGVCPRVESGSTDGHLFLDISGTGRLHGPPPDVAWRLKKRISKETGLDPIWTLAPNKLVAKAASRVVKPTGEYIVGPGEESAFLAPLPLSLLPGLSEAECRIFTRFNITRISQARLLTRAQLAVPFDARAGIIHDLLLGIDKTPVGIRPGPGSALDAAGAAPAAQDVRSEYEFADDTNDAGRLKAGLALMSARICRELRRHGRRAGKMTLTIIHTDTLTRTRSMEAETDSETEMMKQAWALLLAAWTRRVRIRCLTLSCAPRVPVPVQPSLFQAKDSPRGRHRQLSRAVDRIRARFGTLAVQSGAVLGLGPLPAQASRAGNCRP